MSKVREKSERVFKFLNNNDVLDKEIVRHFVQGLQVDEIASPDKALNLKEWLQFCDAMNVVIDSRRSWIPSWRSNR